MHIVGTMRFLPWIVAATTALTALLASCADTEEEVAPGTVATASPTAGSTTPSPGLTLPTCPPLSPDSKPHATPGPSTKPFEIREYGVSLQPPADWTPCGVLPDPQVRDLLVSVDFLDGYGLRSASITVFANPGPASLEDWIRDHDVLFFAKDSQLEERQIAGTRALYTVRSDFGGSVSAYLATGALVFSLGGITMADFDALVEGLRVDGP